MTKTLNITDNIQIKEELNNVVENEDEKNNKEFKLSSNEIEFFKKYQDLEIFDRIIFNNLITLEGSITFPFLADIQ